MTEKQKKIQEAVEFLGSLTRKEWMDYFAQGEKLPYRVFNVAEGMEAMVRDLCPPGFEIDR